MTRALQKPIKTLKDALQQQRQYAESGVSAIEKHYVNAFHRIFKPFPFLFTDIGIDANLAELISGRSIFRTDLCD